MKNKFARYPIIMSILALLCGVIVMAVFAVSAVQPPLMKMSLLLLPSLILGAVALCALKGKLGKSATFKLTTALSILLLVLSVFYILILSMTVATAETKDPRYYSRAYTEVKDEEGVDVFPKFIPDDAQYVSFIYHPQFLQGSELLELSYTTTEDKLAEWISTLESKAVWTGKKEERHTTNNLSARTTIYELYWNGEFNHSEICYVAIDESTKQITFHYSNG